MKTSQKQEELYSSGEHPRVWLLVRPSSGVGLAASRRVWKSKQPWTKRSSPSSKRDLGIWRNRTRTQKGLGRGELTLGELGQKECPESWGRKEEREHMRGHPRSELVRDWRWIKPHRLAFLVHWIKTGRAFVLLGRESSRARSGATCGDRSAMNHVRKWGNIHPMPDTYLTPNECPLSSLSSPLHPRI